MLIPSDRGRSATWASLRDPGKTEQRREKGVGGGVGRTMTGAGLAEFFSPLPVGSMTCSCPSLFPSVLHPSLSPMCKHRDPRRAYSASGAWGAIPSLGPLPTYISALPFARLRGHYSREVGLDGLTRLLLLWGW